MIQRQVLGYVDVHRHGTGDGELKSVLFQADGNQDEIGLEVKGDEP